MNSYLIAIVGRPNVGKSTLFNRLLGFNKAIVHDESGVTRDRHYGDGEWNGKKFTIIDTGGFVPDSHNIYEKAIKEQTEIAISESDKIIFVVDGKFGLNQIDLKIAETLRKSTEKCVLVVNKIDNASNENEISEFYKLGKWEPNSLSALNGRKIGDFLDNLVSDITKINSEKNESDEIKLALIGKPNVGKSSLSNILTGQNRSIVTHLAGTTRDSIDSRLNYNNNKILLIDTAGLVKQKRIKTSVEFYSTIRTIKSIERCDVAIILIDATLELNKQDLQIIELATEKRKPILLVINKWDLIEKDTNSMNRYKKFIESKLRKYNYINQIYISAKTKKRARQVLDFAIKINQEQLKRISTSELNNFLQEKIKNNPPSTKTGKEIKINFITQIKVKPPNFLFFVNEPSLIQENYKRFLERNIREKWGFEGIPIFLNFKKKRKTDKSS